MKKNEYTYQGRCGMWCPRRTLHVTAVGVLLLGTISGCSGVGDDDRVERWQQARQHGFREFRNEHLNEAVSSYEEALQLSPNNLAKAQTLNEYARVRVARGEYAQAGTLYEESVLLLEPLWGNAKSEAVDENPSSALYCEARAGLASVFSMLGQHDKSDSNYEIAIAAAHRKRLWQLMRRTSSAYSSSLRKRGEFEHAAAVSTKAKETITNVAMQHGGGLETACQMSSDMDSAQKTLAAGDLTGAYQQYRNALTLATAQKDHVSAGNCATQLGVISSKLNGNHEAEQWFRTALKHYEDSHAPSISRRGALSGLCEVLPRQKKFDEAARYARQLIADSERLQTTDGHELREAWQALASTYLLSGNYGGAVAPLIKVYQNARQYAGATSADATMTMCYVTNAYWMSDQKDAGEKWLHEYVKDAQGSAPETRVDAAHLMNDYADVCAKSGHADEAVAIGASVRALVGAEKFPKAQAELRRASSMGG